jgi:hypothetical protein
MLLPVVAGTADRLRERESRESLEPVRRTIQALRSRAIERIECQ